MIHTVAIWLTLSLAIWRLIMVTLIKMELAISRLIMIKFPSKAVTLCTVQGCKFVLIVGYGGRCIKTYFIIWKFENLEMSNFVQFSRCYSPSQTCSLWASPHPPLWPRVENPATHSTIWKLNRVENFQQNKNRFPEMAILRIWFPLKKFSTLLPGDQQPWVGPSPPFLPQPLAVQVNLKN